MEFGPRFALLGPVWTTREAGPLNLDMISKGNDANLFNTAAPVSAANEHTVPRASVAPLMRIRSHERSYESHESFEDESSRNEHSESMSVRDMRQSLASPPNENKFIYKPSSGGSHSEWTPTPMG